MQDVIFSLYKIGIMNVKVQAIEFTADQKLLDFVKERVEKLEKYFDRITNVNVYLKLDGKSRQVKDKVVEVKVNIPGNQLFAKEESKKFEEATDLSVNSIKRQLKRHKEKKRG